MRVYTVTNLLHLSHVLQSLLSDTVILITTFKVLYVIAYGILMSEHYGVCVIGLETIPAGEPIRMIYI